jgi:hypothetical protein
MSIFKQETEKSIKELLLRRSWSYLYDNFHKFNEANRIKIALTLVTKDIPQQIEGNVVYTKMNDIEINHNRMEFLIGDNTP